MHELQKYGLHFLDSVVYRGTNGYYLIGGRIQSYQLLSHRIIHELTSIVIDISHTTLAFST